MATRRGDTLIFPKPPVIAAHACIGGKKEGESPLAAEFDELHSDNRLGQASWEAAETQLQLQAARLCLKKAHATEKDVKISWKMQETAVILEPRMTKRGEDHGRADHSDRGG